MKSTNRILSTAMWLVAACAPTAWANSDGQVLEPYRTFGNGWTNTSSGTSSLGAPAVLTWSIAPDGTTLPTGLGEPVSPNDLIEFLDGVHHGGASPGGSDLTQRAWFPLIQSSFERWDQVSGITFNYESEDDGAAYSPGNPGVLGTRGDHRIGGHSIDGQTSPTFVAYNYFPNYSEMVIDTDEIDRWSNSSGNYIRFRNMLMHEIAHGIGLNHVESSDADFLLEPFLATAFDGPQLDDILGAQRLYGDANEEGVGNDTFSNATPLGTFSPGQSISVGVDAVDTVVAFTDIDFLSIDDNLDTDFFRFTIQTPGFVDLTLTPLGPTYQEGPQGGAQNPYVTSAFSDLRFSLLEPDGSSVLQFANNETIGVAEQISNFWIDSPGDYFIQINGAQNAAQFYQLDLAVQAVPEPSTGLLMVAGMAIYGFRRRR